MKVEDGELIEAQTLQKTPNDRNFPAWNVPELRAWIAAEVGCHPGSAESPLAMGTLNSLHAYFTGEFAVPPKIIGTEQSPGDDHLRTRVAIVAYNAGAEDVYGFLPRPERPGEVPNQFRKDELVAIAQAIYTGTDSREWV